MSEGGAQASADGLYAGRCAAQVHHRTSPGGWRDWYRRSPYLGDDGESEAGESGRRCGNGATAHLLEEQGGKRWRADLPRLPLVSLDQTLFRVRAYQKTNASQASHLSVSGLWAGDRSRSECFLEPGTVCPQHASPPFGLKSPALRNGYNRFL